MSLPTELRLKILRNLTTADVVLQSQHHYLKNCMGINPFRATPLEKLLCNRKYFHQSGQLLRVCQKLYDEGCQVIYAEHVLVIDSPRAWHDLSDLEILDQSFMHAPTSLNAIPFLDQPDFQSYLQEDFDNFGTAEQESRLAICPAIARFRAYCISMELTTKHRIFVLSQLFKKILCGKRVALHESAPSPTKLDISTAALYMGRALGGTVTICTKETHQYMPFRHDGRKECVHAVQCGASQNSMSRTDDCFLTFFRFWNNIILPAPSRRINDDKCCLTVKHKDMVDKMHEHVVEDDAVAFHETRIQILRLVLQWTKSWASQEIQCLKQRADALAALAECPMEISERSAIGMRIWMLFHLMKDLDRFLTNLKSNFELALQDETCNTYLGNTGFLGLQCQGLHEWDEPDSDWLDID